MKTCTQCSSGFSLSTVEQTFLKKIDIPAPDLCPLCRRQNRFAWRNERNLYHRECDRTGKQIISIYPHNSPYIVYDQHEWNSDAWDGMDHGRNFDDSLPFFAQWNALIQSTPKLSIFAFQNENSDFTNGAQQDKNCYMIFVSDHNEDCFYSYGIFHCDDCLECLHCHGCTLCIECIDCSDGYNVAYCLRSHNCSDSFFLSDCKNCRNCFGCFGLRNKEYHIFNEPHSKEEYDAKLEQLDTGNRDSLEAAAKSFEQKLRDQHIFQYYDGKNNENVTGDHLMNCRNCSNCFDSAELEDCGHIISGLTSKDCYDGYVVVDNCELCYGTISTINQYNCQFTFVSFESKDSMYLDHCVQCSDCFACSGLKKKQYCIFNTQYTKDAYQKERTKIIDHMKKSGEWGKHLPAELSPFAYNQTIAQEYFPLTKEDATKRGMRWYDENNDTVSAYQGPISKIPDTIADVDAGTQEKIFICSVSNKPFKFMKQEIDCYKKHNLPLPTTCFDIRHKARVAKRNPRILYERKCAKCDISLQSTYAPDRPAVRGSEEPSGSRGETIYCETCYIATIG